MIITVIVCPTILKVWGHRLLDEMWRMYWECRKQQENEDDWRLTGSRIVHTLTSIDDHLENGHTMLAGTSMLVVWGAFVQSRMDWDTSWSRFRLDLRKWMHFVDDYHKGLTRHNK